MKNNKTEPIPVMDYRQYRRARKLVHECCNYIAGNCIALDDGEECICVQSISYSLLCRWFRAAVLPQDKELETALFHRLNAKKCAVCGALFTPGRYLPHRAGRPRKAARMEKIRFSHLHRLQRQVQKRRTADEILTFSGIPPIYTRGIRKPQMPLVTYQSAIYSVPVFT